MPAGATIAVFALVLTAAPDDPSAESEHFKALVLAGEQAFAEGAFGTAVWLFRQADGIRVTPEVAFNLGKLHEKLNDRPMAAYYFRLYLRRAPDASDSLEVAGFLGDILAQAEADGRGLVEVEAPASGEVTLAGRTWVELPAATFLPPGDHPLAARFGDRSEARQVSVLTGRTASVRLEPYPAPLLDAEGRQVPMDMAREERSKVPARRVMRVGAFALGGLSAAALAAGSAFGASSARDAAQVRGPGRGALTVSEARTTARSAEQKGATANALWAAGGAGLLAAGAVFVFTLPEPGGVK